MSNNIDERVVRMEFDNAAFEKGVSQTTETLKELDKNLQFQNASKGFDAITTASTNVDLSSISENIEQLNQKFSILGSVANAVFARITNSAIDAGAKIVDSLTMSGLRDGFAEYELKMGSVQTIMASTGEKLETVNKYLNDLNTYSDKTIYSFSDMTSNIGKFTNAGVKLKDAVSAIQGVANVAAVSGANANEASRAMYNFSQALSTGSVRLLDWRSIENANMSTVEFRQNLLDTAVALKTVKKEGDAYVTTTTDAQGKVSDAFDATKRFTESLNHQWLTTEVLTQTLKNYSTDISEMSKEERQTYKDKLKTIGYTSEQIKGIMKLSKKAFEAATVVKTFSQLVDTVKEGIGSGWAQSMELIIGNFEEAKVLWTSVYEVINKYVSSISDARNQELQYWHDNGGRTALINGLGNVFKALIGYLKPITSFWKAAFPDALGPKLVKLSLAFEEMSKKLMPSKETQKNLTSVFKLLGEGFRIVLDVAKSILKLITPFFKLLSSAGSLVMSIVGPLARLLHVIVAVAQRTNVISNGLAILRTILSGLFGVIQSITRPVVKLITRLTSFNLGGAVKSVSGLTDAFNVLQKLIAPLEKFFKLFSINLESRLNALFRPITREAISEKVESVSSAIKNAFQSIREAFENFGFSFEWVDKVREAFSDVGNSIVNFDFNFSGLEKIKSKIGEFRDRINDYIDSIKSFIRRKKVIYEVKNELANFSKSFSKSISDAVSAIKTGIITKKISPILQFLEKAKKAIGKIASFIAEKVKGLVGNLNKFDLMSIGSGVLGGLFAFKYIKVIKGTFGILSSVSGALESFGGTMDAITGVLENSQKRIKPVTIIAIAASLAALAGAIYLLSTIKSPQNIWPALVAIVVAVAAMSVSMKLLTGFVDKSAAKDLVTGSLALIAIATAMYIVSKALVAVTESIDSPEKIIAAATGLSLALLMIVGALAILSNVKGVRNVKGLGVSLITLSASVYILAKAMSMVGEMETEKLLTGLLVIGGLIIAMSVFSAATGHGKKIFSAAAGMLVLGLAVMAMTGALRILVNAFEEGDMETAMKRVGAIMVLMLAFAVLSRFGRKVFSSAVGMVVLAQAILILTGVLLLLSKIPFSLIATGFLKALLPMVLMAGFLVATGFSKNVLQCAVAIIVLAGALFIMAKAIAPLTELNFFSMIGAVLVLAAALAVLWVAAIMFQNVGVGGAVVIAVLAVSLMLLGAALNIICAIPLGALVLVLVALAVAFAVFAGIMALLAPIAPILIMVASAFLILGIAVIAAGAGIMLVTSALAGLIGIIMMLGALPIDALNSGMEALGKIFGTLAVGALKLGICLIVLGAGLVAVGAGTIIVAVGLLAIGLGLVALGLAFLAFVNIVVSAINLFRSIFDPEAAQQTGQQYTDNLAAGMESGADKIQGVADKIGSGLTTGLQNSEPEVEKSAESVGDTALNGMDISSLTGDLGVDAGELFGDGLGSQAGLSGDMGELLGDNALAGADMEGMMKKVGISDASGLVEGLGTQQGEARTEGTALANAGKSGAESVSFYTAGTNAGSGFGNGLGAMGSIVAQKASSLASRALNAVKNFLGIQSPSKEMMYLGEYSGEGFAKGLDNTGHAIELASESLGETTLNTIGDAVNQAINMVGGISETPVITPVVDLSEVQKGYNQINAMRPNGLNFGASLTGTLSNVAAIRTNQNGADIADAVSSALDKAVKDINASRETADTQRAYSLNVPLTIDGREFARATASYTEAELNRSQARANRNLGVI